MANATEMNDDLLDIVQEFKFDADFMFYDDIIHLACDVLVVKRIS